MQTSSVAILESSEKWVRQMVVAGSDPVAVGLCIGASFQRHAGDWAERTAAIAPVIGHLRLDLDLTGADLLDGIHESIADGMKHLRRPPNRDVAARHRERVVRLVQSLTVPDRVAGLRTRDALHDLGRTVDHLVEGALLVELAGVGVVTPPNAAPDPVALGAAAYASYGVTPPWWSGLPNWVRRNMARRTIRATVRAPRRSASLDGLYALRQAAHAQCEGMRAHFEERQRLVTVYRRLGLAYGPTSPEAIDAAAARHRQIGDEMRRVGQAERAYAGTLGADANVQGIQRASAGVVARHLAYERVVAHADPFVVFEQTRRIAPAVAAQEVAATIEVALVHRIDEMEFDYWRRPDGSVDRRPAGWNLDERRLAAVHAAHAAGDVDRLIAHMQRQWPGDPEVLRVAHLANRLQQSDLLFSAVRRLRPIVTGESADAAPLGWSRREKALAACAFAEIDCRDLPVGPDGRQYRWDELLARHPECRVKASRGQQAAHVVVAGPSAPTRPVRAGGV